MKRAYVRSLLSLAVAGAALSAGVAAADPLPGQILKFQQLPLGGGIIPAIPVAGDIPAPFPGHDELSTARPIIDPLTGAVTGYSGQFMADDFADKFDSPVVHLRWWGSYISPITAGPGVSRFLISFESDVPVGPNNPFSRPGTPLLSQIVTKGLLVPGSGTFTEAIVPTALPGSPDGPLFEYNAELHLGMDFPQKPDTVYWLKIVALIDEPNTIWGWHNRDWGITDPLASTPPAVIPGEGIIGAVPVAGAAPLPVHHFQDDAVTGHITMFFDPAAPGLVIDQSDYRPTLYVPPFDGPSEIGQYSKDLAFELYTVPEPGTLGLMIGTAVVMMIRRRR